MGNALTVLLGMTEDPSRFDYTYDELRELQISAMNERLQSCLDKIKQLELLSSRTQVTKITSLKDMVPLLFSNSIYRAYPKSWISNGRWNFLTKWVESLSSHTATIDLEGVTNLDEWIDRMYSAGHCLTTTSATTGFPAIISSSDNDIEWLKKNVVDNYIWASGVTPEKTHYQIHTSPTITSPKSMETINARMEAFCREENPAWYFPGKQLTPKYLVESRLMENKITLGSASIDEVVQHEKMKLDRQTDLEKAYLLTAEHMIEHRNEPLDITGMWSGQYAIAKIVREKGFSGKDFNPSNIFYSGGGLKNYSLPDDYVEYVLETFNVNPDKYCLVYTMQELNAKNVRCKAGNYHIPPWLVIFLLEENGRSLINYDTSCGQYTGRAGFFDLTLSGRWGGLISGDQVTVNFDACSCGLKGPTVTSITRGDYPDLDKIICSASSL